MPNKDGGEREIGWGEGRGGPVVHQIEPLLIVFYCNYYSMHYAKLAAAGYKGGPGDGSSHW